jgi:hypothetical protein
MAMESVKMGRIPKKLKEKALRDYLKQQQEPNIEQSEDNQDTEIFYDDDTETDTYSLSNDKRESISSLSSFSSSSSSSMNIRNSIDSNQDIVIIPQGK